MYVQAAGSRERVIVKPSLAAVLCGLAACHHDGLMTEIDLIVMQ